MLVGSVFGVCQSLQLFKTKKKLDWTACYNTFCSFFFAYDTKIHNQINHIMKLTTSLVPDTSCRLLIKSSFLYPETVEYCWSYPRINSTGSTYKTQLVMSEHLNPEIFRWKCIIQYPKCIIQYPVLNSCLHSEITVNESYMLEILLDKFGAIVCKNTQFEGWTIYFVRFLSQE